MRALVTGGVGFIGTNLSHRLLSDGYEVILFDNLSRAGVQHNLDWLKTKHGNRFQFVQGDVRDFDAVQTRDTKCRRNIPSCGSGSGDNVGLESQRRFFDKCTRDFKRLGSSAAPRTNAGRAIHIDE